MKRERHNRTIVRLLWCALLILPAVEQAAGQTLPFVPELNAPATGSVNRPILLELSWKPSTYAQKYRVQVAVDQSFGTIAVDTLLDDSFLQVQTVTVGPLQNNLRYYWHVRAENSVGQSAYSATWNFTTIVAAPATPSLTSPLHYATNQPVSQTFRWSAAAGATTYNVQIATDTAFSAQSMLFNDTTITTTSRAVSTLLNNTRYYWRVRAKNIGGISAFTPTWTFLTQLATPVPVTPAKAAVNQPVSLTLTWTPVPGAQSYHVQFSSNSSFTTFLVNDSTLTGTSLDVGPLANSTQYYWRVRAKNDSGGTVFSTAFNFTTIIAKPAAPVLSTPLDGAVNQPASNTLKWFASTGASSYRVQVATDSLFTALLINDTAITQTTRTVTTFAYITKYFWRVIAQNVGGQSPPSAIWSFTTMLPAPTLTAPATNITGVLTPLTFSWTAVSRAEMYRFQLATDAAFKSLLIHDSLVTQTTKTLPDLPKSTTFYWRVSARSTTSESQFSPIWNFQTLIVPPDAPSLTSPANNAANLGTSVILQWTTSPGASVYNLDVATDNAFTTMVFSDTSLMTTNKSFTIFQYNTRYYWRVRAKNTSGWGTYSNFWTFATTMAQPVLRYPENNAVNVPITLTMKWDTLPGATSYKFQLSTLTTFTTLLVDDSSLVEPSRFVTGLVNNTKYYWRVLGKNAGGNGAFSLVSIFTSVVALPAPPKLWSPTNGAVSQPVTADLRWNSSTGATGYRCQVSRDSLFRWVEFEDSTLTGSAWKIGVLSNSEVYYWRVQAKNAAGWGGYSETWHFATLIVIPEPPKLAAPASNSSGLPRMIQLVWNGSHGAKRYRLQMSTDSPFDTLYLNNPPIKDTSLLVGPLDYGMRYYWRVSAINDSGESAYSAVWNLTTGLTPPLLETPINGARGLPTTLSFLWVPVPRMVSYQFQVSTDSLFQSMFYQAPAIVTNAIDVVGFAHNTKYFWRVGARDVYGGVVFSETFSFYTRLEDLTTPSLLNPANNATYLPTTVIFTWMPSTGAISYRLEVSRDTPFQDLVLNDSTVTATSDTLAGLENSRTYYWRVTAKDPNGRTATSVIRTFSTVPPKPPAPVLYSPANGAIAVPLSTLLRWNPATDASKYRVQVATDTVNSATLFVDDSTVTDINFRIDGLDPERILYWRVQATNIAGVGKFSSWWSFTTRGGVPAMPRLKSPVSSAVNVPAAPLLCWKPVWGADRYMLQVSEDSPFQVIIYQDTAITDTVYRMPQLENSKQYFWRVRARNTNGVSEYSEVWRFTTIVAVPDIPRLALPMSSSREEATSVRLVWMKSERADCYHVQVSDDSPFRTFVFEDSTVTDTSVVAMPLRLNIRYYWRVRARNVGGYSSFSEVWNFVSTIDLAVERDGPGIPKDYFLGPNYPNPFNPSTTIRFGIAGPAHVGVAIYDLLGRELERVHDGALGAGFYSFRWNAAGKASGVYLVRMSAEGFDAAGRPFRFAQTRKLVLGK